MWEKGVGHLVNEKEGILMKLLFCKIHCPIMCFCKPHIYNSDSTNTHQYHVSSTAVADAASESDESSCSEVKEEECLDVKEEKPVVVLKSCVKKIHSDESDVIRDKKRVSWVDDLGLELAEVKEFESRYDSEGGNICICVIL